MGQKYDKKIAGWRTNDNEQNPVAYRADYGVVYDQLVNWSGVDGIFDLLHGHWHYCGCLPWLEWELACGSPSAGVRLVTLGSFQIFFLNLLDWFGLCPRGGGWGAVYLKGHIC